MLASSLRRLRRRRGYAYLGGWGTCCCGGTKICLTGCLLGIQGATIQLYSSGVLVNSHTTDSSGCCTFTESGTYDVKSVISGAVHDWGNKTLSGTTINLNLSSGDTVICCTGCNVPTNLTLSTSDGTTAFTWDAGQSIWHGCFVVTVALGGALNGYQTSGFTCNNCWTPTTSYPVYFWGKCDPLGTAKFLVGCDWNWILYNPTPPGAPCNPGDFRDCSYASPPAGCSRADCSGDICGGSTVCKFQGGNCLGFSGTIAQTTLLQAWSSCGPSFSWSGTLPTPSPYCSICPLPSLAVTITS